MNEPQAAASTGSEKPSVPGWYECRRRDEIGRYVRYFDGQYIRWKPGDLGLDVDQFTEFVRYVPGAELVAENERLRGLIEEVAQQIEREGYKAWAAAVRNTVQDLSAAAPTNERTGE